MGLLGLITNHSYLDNPTMRALRYSINAFFQRSFIYDLGGSAKKLADEVDENVFDIQQGVAIGVFVRGSDEAAESHLHAHLSGTREEKYKTLAVASISSTLWAPLSPTPPFFLLVPTDYILRTEYDGYVALSQVFALKSIGLFTSKDSLVIDFDARAVESKVRSFQKSDLSNSDLCDSVGITAKAAWNVTKSRERLAAIDNLNDHIVRFLHRPFDSKFLFYDRSLVWSMAWPVNRNLMSKGNVALTVSRQLAMPPWTHVFCSDTIVELCYITNKTKEGNHVFPLYLLPDEGGDQRSLVGQDQRRPNLSPAFIRLFATTLGLPFDDRTFLPEGLSAEDIFNYAYAVFHSPVYRSRYEEFLKIDFPRLPLIGSLDLFRALSRLGGDLVALHLLRSPDVAKPTATFTGSRVSEIEKISWARDTVWLDRAQTVGFRGVSEEVWNFHIGAYPVCQKWLKDRKGRRLSTEEFGHYEAIIVALSRTIRLMGEIDAAIEEHGGWPGAFVTTEAEA